MKANFGEVKLSSGESQTRGPRLVQKTDVETWRRLQRTAGLPGRQRLPGDGQQ